MLNDYRKNVNWDFILSGSAILSPGYLNFITNKYQNLTNQKKIYIRKNKNRNNKNRKLNGDSMSLK